MKTDLLADRHIGIQEEDLPVMLEKIGVKSLDELINKTIPSKIRLKEPLPLAAPMTEREFAEHITELASQNKIYTSYIGMGWYDSITPAVIQRNVFENPVWYTSYTPYQTEVSQGRLEALMNFQTVISDLTAMPLANCSLLDESTAAAEAATMMYGLRTRDQQKSGANVLFVDEEIFPQNLAVIQTRALPQGMKIQVGNYKELVFTPEIFACILQYPNASGSVEDYREFVEKAHAAHCKVAVDADIMSLALLVPPGEWGADIVFGSTQRLGIPLFYGGPSAAYFATRDEYKRNMPGRIIGNGRNTPNEQQLLQEFAKRLHTQLIAFIPRDVIVNKAENNRQTVLQYAPESAQAGVYRKLAHDIWHNENMAIPTPMSFEELEKLVAEYGN